MSPEQVVLRKTPGRDKSTILPHMCGDSQTRSSPVDSWGPCLLLQDVLVAGSEHLAGLGLVPQLVIWHSRFLHFTSSTKVSGGAGTLNENQLKDFSRRTTPKWWKTWKIAAWSLKLN